MYKGSAEPDEAALCGLGRRLVRVKLRLGLKAVTI